MLDVALARTDHDFTISGRAGASGSPRARARPKPARKWLRNGYMGLVTGRNLRYAAISLLVGGFLVNALALQNAHHPAPLFVPPRASVEAAVAPVAPADTPLPVPRPTALASSVAVAPPPKPVASQPVVPGRAAVPFDPIAQLLRPHVPAKLDAAGRPEPVKSILAAQKALVKLGFALKPDGVFGGTTRQAIERFERDQGMPVKGDLSPKIMRQLATESGLPVE